MPASDALPYRIVDVFTDSAFAGNPLAVVFDADGLSDAALQAIAREFNLSETVFPLPLTAPSVEADYRLRIFTPSTELPFAGHPSVGAAWVMRDEGRIASGATRAVQECGAGLLPLEFDGDAIRLTGGTLSIGERVDAAPLLAAVGLELDDLDIDAGPVRWCGAGIDFGFVPVRREALGRCRPDLLAVAAAGGAGISVFALATGSGDLDVVADTRVFAGGAGVLEDPATGSAAIGFGAWLGANGHAAADGVTAYLVRQGFDMGRPSLLHGQVELRGGRPVSGSVAGQVVEIARGTIRPPVR